MHEHELSTRLEATAARVSARPDLAEVELGAARVRGRRRVTTGVIAAMLIAGAGGTGFGLGQSVGGDDAGSAAEPIPTATTVPEPTTPVTTAPAAPAAAPAPTTTIPAGVEVANSDTAGKSAADVSYASAMGMPEPYEFVLERRLDTGYRVRALRGPSYPYEMAVAGEEDRGPNGGWVAPSFCYGGGELRVTIDGPDLVDVTSGQWFEQLFGPAAASANDVGWADGHLMRVVVVQVADATEVGVTWDDGATDRAAVVDGVAVLVTDGGGAYEHTYTVELVGPSGTQTVDGTELQPWSSAEYQQACTPPPPALPEAGEQPADPAAARAAFDERFALLWDRTVEDKPAGLIDDDTGIEAATEAVFAGGFAEAAESAQHVIEEFVFTSPTEAWFRYGIDTSNGYFGQRYGFATLNDDGWTFPRALVCQDLSLAGGTCEPQPYQIYPPSWYDQSGGQQCIYDPIDGAETCATFDEVMISFG